MPRSQFDQELNKMHVDLDRMCHLVVLAIENCVTAFKEQDYELARDIIHGCLLYTSPSPRDCS